MTQTHLQPDQEEITKNCDCTAWLENIDKVNKAFTILWIHGGIGYEGVKFEYCPWCGKLLKEDTDAAQTP